MQLSVSFTCLVAALASSAIAFGPTAFAPRSTTAGSTTSLSISSWGTKGSPYVNKEGSTKVEDPEAKIQSYLKAPEPVETRSHLTKSNSVLVSGLVKTKERTDQTVFDLLNDEDSSFDFGTIAAFCRDEKFAKKRLLSRSARYTGLLDKLDFIEATEDSPDLPTVQQLTDKNIDNWVAYIEDCDLLEMTKKVGSIAQEAGVKNLSILLVGANGLDVTATKAAVETLSDTYSVIAVGKLEEHPEGKVPYQFRDLGTENGTIPADAIFSRDESLRMVTECLQLEAGLGKTMACTEVYDVNQTEAKLIKGLREGGYTRPQEIDHMLRDGAANYKKAVDDYREKNPNAEGTGDRWWERPEFALKHQSYEEEAAMRDAEIKAKRNAQVETIAKEWAKREYYRESMAGSLTDGLSEDDFVKSVWERAMFEADLKFRQMQGESTDEETEMADFKKKQDVKGQAMLKKAKQELNDLLEEEDLGGIDDNLIAPAATTDDDDDDKE